MPVLLIVFCIILVLSLCKAASQSDDVDYASQLEEMNKVEKYNKMSLEELLNMYFYEGERVILSNGKVVGFTE